MSKNNDIISEFEAAVITKMSPTLLNWLTRNAPKSGLPKKLKIAKVEKGRTFYERKEVLAFDSWLKKPWPSKNGGRPNIPSEIRREIRVEANGSCAMCQGHKDTCEAAHIEPVAKTFNNHPENLIWLCSNHHTAYDKGFFGPKTEDAEFVVSLKNVLRRCKAMQWQMQVEISIEMLTILENCDLLKKQLMAAKTNEQISTVEIIAQDVLDKLPSLAPISTDDPKYNEYNAVSLKINKLAKSKKTVHQRLNSAKKIRQEYVAALGMIACPLCEATGKHDSEDCPICDGDREVEAQYAELIDLNQYQKIDCPLCDGAGIRNGKRCPVCGGEAYIERRFADQIDLRDYKMVDCPVCENKAKNGRDECRACGGEGEMPQHDADQIDLRDYKMVDCPVCENKAKNRRDECRACGGEGEMPQHDADQIDLRDYKMVDCPVCENKAKNRRDECRACGGEGEMPQHDADQIDLRY
jgi:DnaJ-class molecular chaperone